MRPPDPGAPRPDRGTGLALGSAGGRWLIAASVLGSGLAFLDSTAVNVALPAIGRELGGGLGVQQWVLDGYLLTLSALLLLGGALGDRYGRKRVFVGAAMLPITVLMLVLSPRMGALVQRIGPRLPMTAGPLVAGAGLALMARVAPGAAYLTVVLPAVAVFGLGLSLTVTPLTSAMLAAVSQDQAGLASGANNAVARLAGLFAVAALPLLAGISSTGGGLGPGFARAMLIAAGACAAGGLIAWATIPAGRPGWP